MVQNIFKGNAKDWIVSNDIFVFGYEQRDISVTQVHVEEEVRL